MTNPRSVFTVINQSEISINVLCLHRIHCPESVKLRAPVSESLSRLQRDQLQKFAQYLINDSSIQQILPTAQRLLDELLSNCQTDINTTSGAPDPTAGGNNGELSNWTLDAKNLRDNIKKILIKVRSKIFFRISQ